MKVLWITNTFFPDICKELNIPVPVVGGWMYSGAMALLEVNKNIELSVATIYNGRELRQTKIKGITYFLLPGKKGNKKYNKYLEDFWKMINVENRFNVIHIHGTEYPHGLAYVRSCGNENVVVSVQGLVHIYERYFHNGIEKSEIVKNITLKDVLTKASIFKQKKDMHRRGILEKELILSAGHLIGRTTWDRDHLWAINPTAQYHFGNETLRGQFYQDVWITEECERFSIFLSQAHYPLKGLHQMIKALPFILRDYPKTKVYIAGNDFLTNKGLRLSGYGKYIRSLIKEYKVANNVVFTGILSEAEMVDRYVRSHVFVCPSSIENSSNSIGEAQLLGVPCIASFVGGVQDMISDKETGLLYRFEEVEMLAAAVCKIFSDDNLSYELSIKGRKAALARHDKRMNARSLVQIYTDICKNTLH